MKSKEQRIQDFMHSTGAIIGGGSILNCAKILFKNIEGNTSKFGYCDLAIPVIILWVNSFEIFLNEIIFMLGFDFNPIIDFKKKERLSKLTTAEKFKEIRKIIDNPKLSEENKRKLNQIIEARNDLVHHFPRDMYTDEVSKQLDKLNLLLPAEIAANRYASIKLAKYVRKVVIDLVDGLREEIAESNISDHSFIKGHIKVLSNNFVSE